MPRPAILIVEDDADIQQLVSFSLIKSGFSSMCAESGEQALEMLTDEIPACVILDLMLPGMDGMEVCRRIRQMTGAVGKVPVIMLTARGEDEDVVAGLEAGADDYVSKPFSPKVLISRVRAVLRRNTRIEPEETAKNILRCGPVTLDFETHQATHRDTPMDLTITEFRILAMLMETPGRVYSRGQIIETVRGYGYSVTSRAVDVQIHGIRKKLGEDSHIVETVRGLGYRFADKGQAEPARDVS